MPEILLIGYGNPLRGDDGIGWRIAQWFEEKSPNPGFQCLVCHQLTPDLADEISRVRLVIFIDAREGGEPGTIICEEISPCPVEPGAFTHHVSPSHLLFMAFALFHHAPQAFLVTITGEQFDYEERLSDRIEAAIPQAITAIQQLYSPLFLESEKRD